MFSGAVEEAFLCLKTNSDDTIRVFCLGPGYHTFCGDMEFRRHGHLPGREDIIKHTIVLHYGNVGSSVFQYFRVKVSKKGFNFKN